MLFRSHSPGFFGQYRLLFKTNSWLNSCKKVSLCYKKIFVHSDLELLWRVASVGAGHVAEQTKAWKGDLDWAWVNL